MLPRVTTCKLNSLVLGVGHTLYVGSLCRSLVLIPIHPKKFKSRLMLVLLAAKVRFDIVNSDAARWCRVRTAGGTSSRSARVRTAGVLGGMREPRARYNKRLAEAFLRPDTSGKDGILIMSLQISVSMSRRCKTSVVPAVD